MLTHMCPVVFSTLATEGHASRICLPLRRHFHHVYFAVDLSTPPLTLSPELKPPESVSLQKRGHLNGVKAK